MNRYFIRGFLVCGILIGVLFLIFVRNRETLLCTEMVPYEAVCNAGKEPVLTPSTGANGTDLYFELLKLSLTDLIYERNAEIRKKRIEGADFPGRGVTMIGLKRLNNIQHCIEDVIEKKVPGDFIEAGAWRGGATIFMRGILRAHGITDRTVWVADSFEGLPRPDVSNFPQDSQHDLSGIPELAVSKEEVMDNFKYFGLLDNQVQFLKGWFKDTFPTAPIKQLAILRMDGDLYESTWQTLEYLYPKVSVGGYIIADDYALAPERKAVNDYRKKFNITDELLAIDQTGVYWKKSK